jgi:heme o synthase
MHSSSVQQPFSIGRYSQQLLKLTKPRITIMAGFCALIGMLLAAPSVKSWALLTAATSGISLLAAAGFVVNCLAERHIDAQMARTQRRPAARGDIGVMPALVFAGLIGSLGAAILLTYVNQLTMWLTLATFVGYALVYTLLLKPATPQNIVIGGASGAMPPLLGWVAVTNDIGAPAIVMFLIVFLWTPPHFWALALYRVEDYKKSGLPMLPVTHGMAYTQLNVWLYTILMVASTLLPFVIRTSGYFYLVSAFVLGGVFLWYSWQVWRHYSDAIARKTFKYSIWYLLGIFAALLVDHFLA